MQQLIQFDQLLSTRFSTFVGDHFFLATLFKILGVGLVYIVPAILIFVWFTGRRKVALQGVVTGLLAWEVLSKIIASLVDRPRPAMSQIGAKELIFHRPDTSFPSDHSAFLMALALSFYLSGQKRLGHVTLVIAIVVGIARVGIGVHFPGDIVAGWLIGIMAAYIIQLVHEPLDRYILEPGVHLARKLRL